MIMADQDINYLLSKLSTLEGRSKVLMKALEKDQIRGVNPEHIREASLFFEKEGNLVLAARLAGAIGDTNRESILYERQINLWPSDMAAELCVQLGQEDRAIKLLEGARRYAMAAELAEKKGYAEVAITNWERANEFIRAAELSQRVGDNKRARIYFASAIQSYEADGNFVKAAELAEVLGETDLATAYKTLADLLK